MRIEYTATQHVRDVIAGLGRTEDIKFSPSNQRLAIAAYVTNKIAVFDVGIDYSPKGAKIVLTDTAEIHSSYFKHPHGLDFIDDETIIVANRRGDVPILRLPPGKLGGNRYEVEPLEIISSGDGLQAPGSLSVTRKDRDLYEALICNNDGNRITQHLLDVRTGCSAKSHRALLKKWLDVPDGISVSTGAEWIAVSNHKMHSVLVYENSDSLNVDSDPVAILRFVYYPHGLQFTNDNAYILVADAGSPYVHIYRKDGPSWRGVRNPFTSFRVLSEDEFIRGRYNPMDGGPKGLDINKAMNVLVTTNERQPLAFFDLAEILTQVGKSERDDQSAYELRYELDIRLGEQENLKKTKARGDLDLAKLTNSTSWRVTAPLRGMAFLLRQLVRPNDKSVKRAG